jgi:hypothetical protein
VRDESERRIAMPNLLWAVAAFLVVMWMFGFALHVTGGGLIHFLLVLALIAVAVRLLMGGQSRWAA